MRLLERIKNRIVYIVRFIHWRLLKLVTKKTTITTKYGKYSVLMSDDVIGYLIFLRRQYDTQKFSQIVSFLKENKFFSNDQVTLLDIGANNGVIGIQALMMGVVSKVISIEPEPKNFNLLLENIQLNLLSEKVHPVQVAISDAPQEIEFELDETNSGDNRVRLETAVKNMQGEGSRKTIKVPSNSLNNITASVPAEFTKGIDFCWMDIQGFEGMAIKHGDQVFGSGIPTIIEVWPYGLKRAGMEMSEFEEILKRYWSHYYLVGGDQFELYEISQFKELALRLDQNENFEDVLFIKK